jgi:hypothetical protein
MVKILNVMDELSNFKSLGNGEYESGYWSRPDLHCTIIRLFGKDGETSFLGGEIQSERIEERDGKKGRRKIKIFVFKDDPLQHGKPRPPRFRANGCVATNE